MITAICTGGIGNRLFQMCAAVHYAEEFKREPVLYLPMIYESDHDSSELLYDFFPTLKRIEFDSSISTSISISISNTTQEELNISNTDSNLLILKIYFQDMKHFPLNSPLLPKLPVKIPSKKSVAIHFRFGDYMDLKHHQMNLSSYYMTAIQKFPKETHFTLFSDTSKKLGPISRELWIKGYSNSIHKSTSPLQTLQEIASCSLGCIGANSTFSWWAAYFGFQQSNGSYVAYFPDKWTANQQTPNLFTLPFMKVLSVEFKSASKTLGSFSYS